MSKHKFTVVHRADPNNVGDLASNPLQYFLQDDQYQVVDVTNLGLAQLDDDLPLIVGGGGLIANDFLDPFMNRLQVQNDILQLRRLFEERWNLCSSVNKGLHKEFTEEFRSLIQKYIKQVDKPKNFRAVWGAGHNSEVARDKKGNLFIEYPNWLVDYDLVGIRDHTESYDWVPCASSMHSALRKKYAIKNDIIWFEHKKQLLKDFGSDPIPRFINSGSNVEQTIELLGSANIILTNSYHGAFWGTLLKKRVIVVGAWSSKFYKMKHTPYVLEKGEDWKKAIESVRTYNDALDECITKTESFWKSIKERT